MSSRLRLIAWLGLLAVSGCAISGCALLLSSETKTIRTDYCQPLEDDPSGMVEQQRRDGLRAMGEPGRRALLKLARDRKTERCALDFLTSLGDPRAIPRLHDIARDPQSDTGRRTWALSSLARFGDDWAVDQFVALVDRGDDPAMTRAAIYALSSARQPQAGAALRRYAADERSKPDRALLVEALGEQRNPADIPLIVRLVEVGLTEWSIGRDVFRTRGAAALVKIGTPESVAAIPDVMRGTWEPGRRSNGFDLVSSLLRQARQASSVSPELAKAIDATQATLQQLATAELR
jgi:hypothetical protein